MAKQLESATDCLSPIIHWLVTQIKANTSRRNYSTAAEKLSQGNSLRDNATYIKEIFLAAILSYVGMMIGSIGIFFGFYYFSSNPQASLSVVTLTTVGIVGILAFVRHVIFHKSDAK
ncbi:hypothetical protein [Propionivibrio sp.]|uniref:hypothetical protein n=1 Tax=Propionivibrio sp. TaxID=2212460 RepID=UPI003BEFD28C